ncbi:MAG TPA: preprotein translocase subunit SecG [Candidatus Paceibacterota bacterium]|nr:preprotein translocase subunit SecG [Candidatus Paceibacterota bacterium]
MLTILQVIVSVALIVFVLLQERASGLGAMGGGGGGTPYQTRRGMEKFIYWGTIVLAFAFVVLAILNLVY